MTVWQTILVYWERCNACGECLTACTREMARQGQPHPDVPRLHIPWQGQPAYVALCRHCAEAPCLDACISGAIRLDGGGRVVLEDALCVGCWMCATHCPFGAITGVGDKAVKCNLCTPAGVTPPCVRACPEGALTLASAETAAAVRARGRAHERVGAILGWAIAVVNARVNCSPAPADPSLCSPETVRSARLSALKRALRTSRRTFRIGS